MIKERKGDSALRVCDNCSQEQWVNYWNIKTKNRHLCRYCNNAEQGEKRKGKYNGWNKGKRQDPRKVGSFYLNANGYYEVWIGKHTLSDKVGGYYLEHRLMAEVAISRELLNTEKVHHIDGDKTNNTFSNLHVCSNDADHRHVHSQLERLSMELVKSGLIIFDSESGAYCLDPYLREQVRKSGELLENPNEKDEGNQQRSLRDMTHEERSETIQKWSTLKRAEAPDTLIAGLATGDDIVPSPPKDGADRKVGQGLATLVEDTGNMSTSS